MELGLSLIYTHTELATSSESIFYSHTRFFSFIADLEFYQKGAVTLQAGLYTCLLPSLFFTYLGQAAYLIRFPDGVQSVYYNSLPNPVYWPMFVIATLASIVASQVNFFQLSQKTCNCKPGQTVKENGQLVLSSFATLEQRVKRQDAWVLRLQSRALFTDSPHRDLWGFTFSSQTIL